MLVKQRIKVRLKDNGPWVDAYFLEDKDENNVLVQVGEDHYFNKKQVLVARNNFTRFEQMTEAALELAFNEQAPKAMAMLTAAVNALLPGEEITLNREDRCIDSREMVTMQMVVGEQQQIGCIREVPMWCVSTFHEFSGNWKEPDGVDEIEHGEFVLAAACRKLISLMQEDKANGFWQQLADEEYAKQQQDWDDNYGEG